MTFRDLLIEAIERAEGLAGHHEALCLIDRHTHERISYTLDECKSLIQDLDSPASI